MTESDFHLLVDRVLAGAASPEEQAQFERLLADPGRRREFDELRVARTTLKDASVLLQSVHGDPEPMPAESLKILLDQIRSRRHAVSEPPQPPLIEWARVLLSRRAAVGALAAVGGCLILGWLIFNRTPTRLAPTGPAAHLIVIRGDASLHRGADTVAANPVQSLFEGDRIQLEAGAEARLLVPTGIRNLQGPSTTAVADFDVFPAATSAEAAAPAVARAPLEVALFKPRHLLAAGLRSTTRSAEGISIYSPRVATARLEPIILWRAEPGATYELTLSDELNPQTTAWQVTGVRPPVDFAEVQAWRDRPLLPGEVYRLVIRQTGRPLTASEITFSTLTPARQSAGDAPADRLLAAYEALAGSPSRTGDALVELFALPEPFATSELALRLKLTAFGRLGFAAEFRSVQSELERLP